MFRFRLPLLAALALAGAAPAAEELVVFDARQAPPAEALSLACLQGVVNRDAPRLYLALHDADLPWPDLYARAFGVPLARAADRAELLRRFRPRLQGYILWDPAVPDTANLATTLAGLDDCLVAAPDQEAEAKALGLACRHDLRGQFAGKSPAAVYAWARENLWPRCSRELVGDLPAAAPPPLDLDVSRILAESGDLFLRLEDATPADANGARLHSLRLEWSENAGQGRPAYTDAAQAIAFRPGTDGELPYLLDPATSRIDPQGDRAADGEQQALYRFMVTPGCQARLVIEVTGHYLLRASGRPSGAYEDVARAERPVRRPDPGVRDVLVARRALVLDLAVAGALPSTGGAPPPRVLAGGPANRTVHGPLAAGVLGNLPHGGLAAPVAAFAASDLLHTCGTKAADAEASVPEVRIARPGEDKAGGHLLYGPYVPVPPGRYAVAWRLKAVGPLGDAPLAALDVFDVRDGSRYYAQRTVKGTEFPAGRYHWVVLPFELPKPATLEYRVQWLGGAELRADRIVVWAF